MSRRLIRTFQGSLTHVDVHDSLMPGNTVWCRVLVQTVGVEYGTLGCQLQRHAGTHKGAGAGWSACQMVLAAAVGNHELQRGGSRSAPREHDE